MTTKLELFLQKQASQAHFSRKVKMNSPTQTYLSMKIHAGDTRCVTDQTGAVLGYAIKRSKIPKYELSTRKTNRTINFPVF